MRARRDEPGLCPAFYTMLFRNCHTLTDTIAVARVISRALLPKARTPAWRALIASIAWLTGESMRSQFR